MENRLMDQVEVQIGDTVFELLEPQYKGRAVQLDRVRNEWYIQWHKGYATWVHCSKLAKVN
jgi:hypothetical protein